jgi:TolB-like protein
MAIWSAEIKELEKLYESHKGQFSDLEKELERLVKADDENMILLYSRRCLEVIITDLCECELKRPRKTEPLKGIIDKLHKEEKVPYHIITSMHGLNEMSTFGAHPKDFDPEQIKPVLINLNIVLKWYLKYRISGKEIKTRPMEEIKQEIKGNFPIKRKKIVTGKRMVGLTVGLIIISAIALAVLFLTDIIGRGSQSEGVDKSVAILPFHNDSPDEENVYFINGMMEAILDNLCKIEDLKVISRTSVEQYRNTTKSIPQIAKELHVRYILEGSGQKYQDKINLTVQLLDAANDKHIWSSPYNREVNDIFLVQSEIAQLIAIELKALITPEEKQLIEKTPTTSLTAYDFFRRGKEEHWKYIIVGDKEALDKAEDLYYKALEYDSAFAQAYAGLAWVYRMKNFWTDYFSKNFLDSTLLLANIALSFDAQLSEAYTIRGAYYYQLGKSEQAIAEAEKATRLNPNDGLAYFIKGFLYSNLDFIKSIENFDKAIFFIRGSQLPTLLINLGWVYHQTGFIEKFRDCVQEALKLDNDSLSYYANLAKSENLQNNYRKALELYKKSFAIDSTNISIIRDIGMNYMFLGDYKESLGYFKKYLEKLENSGEIYLNGMHRIGYIYWQNGYKEEADYFFNKQLDYCNEAIELGREYGQNLNAYYDLAGIYAFRGERDKAYKNLEKFSQRQCMSFYTARFLTYDPLFSSIRNEPEFQKIITDIEAKYMSEHEKVEKWLEDQGML